MSESGFTQTVLDIFTPKNNQGGGRVSNDNSNGSRPSNFTPMDGTTPNTTPITNQDIADAIRNAQTMQQLNKANKNKSTAGSNAGNQQIEIIDKYKTPMRSWKAIMQDIVRKTVQIRSFSKINNRLAAARVVAPSTRNQLVNSDIIFAIDASGSMIGDQLTDVVNELLALSRYSSIINMRVLYWDAKVMNDISVKNSASLISSPNMFNFTGGGGTNIDCVYNYIVEKRYKPTSVIYLTDGFVMGNLFYIQHNCKNIVMLTYEGDYKGMNDIKHNKNYTNSQLQIVRTNLGKPSNF